MKTSKQTAPESISGKRGNSIWHQRQEWEISRNSPQRILIKDLYLRAYKTQLTQQRKTNNHVIKGC